MDKTDSTNKTVKLVGTSNYVKWHRKFERAAKDKDVWDLLKGDFKPMKSEPDLDDNKY